MRDFRCKPAKMSVDNREVVVNDLTKTFTIVNNFVEKHDLHPKTKKEFNELLKKINKTKDNLRKVEALQALKRDQEANKLWKKIELEIEVIRLTLLAQRKS